ncbi:MAG TPA: ABC transporter permease [Puia sp.]|nr:ABC transporter permease [Puia sp.]
MIRNILLVTWRNFKRHRAYTFINIIGLAIGLAVFILIGAYVHFEKSYDRMHAGADNIYRVESSFYRGDQLTDSWPTSTNGYAKAMKDALPGITSFARINWNNSERVIRYNGLKYREEHVCFADSNFFSFFSYPLLKGDVQTVLKEVNSIVLSESAAKKYFGNEDPVGKFLDVSTQSKSYHCAVTGVFKDIPANSTMQFNFLISWATTPEWMKDFWYIHESYTFVKLRPGTNIPQLEAQFPDIAERYKTAASFKELKWAIHLVPLADMHLNPVKPYEIEAKGNRYAVNLLSIMAYIILIIASVNYINLATTRSIDRAREVGIRKVSGAHASQLIFQFLLESFIINLSALALAALLVIASFSWLPFFLSNTGVKGLLFDKPLYIYTGVVFIVSTLLSGIYPAMVLVKLKPVTALKGRFSFSKKGVLLRKGMVSFQFVASLLLIAGTLAVYRQIAYMGSQDIGTDISQTLVIKAPVNTADYLQKIQSLKTALQAIPGVRAVTMSGSVPGREVREFLANRRYGASKAEERAYEMLKVDHDYIKAYGLQVIAGRGFDRSRPSDSIGVVMNESAVQQFGFPSAAAAVGQKVWLETVDKRPNEIIGVIKDYHQQSLQQKYTPVILFMDPALGWIRSNYFSVKINSNQMQDKVAQLKRVWNDRFPESSFDFFFLDEFYNRQYQQEVQFGHNFMIFSSLAIFIACMGLFGLTAYSTARRTKEIGVRKVLGASVRNIMILLTWDLIRLILYCSLAAIPIAVILIIQWLNGYAFRVQLTWWQFILPVFTLVLIAIVTTVWLTFKAALTNPTATLKNE